MQPVQDLTVEIASAGRNFSTAWRILIPKELAIWVPKLIEKLQTLPNCGTWPAISRIRACRRSLVIDRDTASRLGITPQNIDDALYDAFGQRQISTMFTQLNQYHVVLEVKPEFPDESPQILKDIYVALSDQGEVSALSDCSRISRRLRSPLGDQSSGAISRR